jgi:RNA polymerase sporulation-specific sigma factor
MSARYAEMNLPRFPRLSDVEVNQYIKLAQQGDEKARERLVNCNLRLVFTMIQRFQNRGYETEDLFQIGVIGLIKAIDKFDLQYEVKFSTYAVPMIMGEIRRYIRDDGPVKVSRTYKDNARLIRQTQEQLADQLGREPTMSELSEALDMPLDVMVASLEAVAAPVSLYEAVNQDDNEPIYRLDQIKGCEEESDTFNRLAMEEVMDQLQPREKEIIRLRFYEDLTQAQVARRLGLSQVQISRLERQILQRCRELLTDH